MLRGTPPPPGVAGAGVAPRAVRRSRPNKCRLREQPPTCASTRGAAATANGPAQRRRLAVVERVFQYFAGKLDQRDGALGALLDAADEITYSLYVQAFRGAGLAEPPPPLAYVEPAFSPRALPRDEPPAELRSD